MVAPFVQPGDDEDNDDDPLDGFAERGLDPLEVIDFLEDLEHPATYRDNDSDRKTFSDARSVAEDVPCDGEDGGFPSTMFHAFAV